MGTERTWCCGWRASTNGSGIRSRDSGSRGRRPAGVEQPAIPARRTYKQEQGENIPNVHLHGNRALGFQFAASLALQNDEEQSAQRAGDRRRNSGTHRREAQPIPAKAQRSAMMATGCASTPFLEFELRWGGWRGKPKGFESSNGMETLPPKAS